MPIYEPRQFNLKKDELPDELPINLKAFEDVQPDLSYVPKPVNPSKIMFLKMLVIMGSLGALLLVLGMAAILLNW